MKGVLAGILGPTGPCPLVPTGMHLYQGLHIRCVTGTAFLGATGLSPTGVTNAGFPLSSNEPATGPAMFLRIDNPAALHAFVPTGAALRFLGY